MQAIFHKCIIHLWWCFRSSHLYAYDLFSLQDMLESELHCFWPFKYCDSRHLNTHTCRRSAIGVLGPAEHPDRRLLPTPPVGASPASASSSRPLPSSTTAAHTLQFASTPCLHTPRSLHHIIAYRFIVRLAPSSRPTALASVSLTKSHYPIQHIIAVSGNDSRDMT